MIYTSLFLSIFINLDSQYYTLVKPVLDISRIDSYLTYVTSNIPKLLHWQYMIFGFAIGVGLYIMNVEFRRKNISDRDLMGIQVDVKELYNLNPNIHAMLLVLLWVGLFFVSWLALSTVILIEVMLPYASRRIRILALSVFFMLLLHSFYLWSSLYVPHTIYQYLLTNGIMAFVKLQIFEYKNAFLTTSGYWLLPYLLIKIVFELKHSKQALHQINEQNTVQQAKIKFRTGDFTLGANLDDGSVISLTDAEMNQHMFILGATGAGKTVAILNMVLHAAKKNYPLIFIDGKGQVDLVERLAKIANDCGRVFKVFTLRPEAVNAEHKQYIAAYNPFSAGTFTEWKNRILSLFADVKGKGQQHFALLEEDLVNSVVQVLFKMGKTVDLDSLYKTLSNMKFLIEFAQKNGDKKLAEKLANVDEELVKDVIIMLGLFVESSYGHLFQTKAATNVISLRDSIENNEMILFLLDSAAYKSDTEKMAKLIINDINSSFSELVKPKTSYCIFDEFASYASGNLSDTVSLMRSKGMCAVIGTQSIISVGLKSEETKRVAEELKSCCNTYLCLKINNEQDAEIVSKVYNTQDVFEVTTQIDVSVGGATGMGSSKSIKAFNVHPEQLKNLGMGEGYLYRKVAKLKPVKIKVNDTRY